MRTHLHRAQLVVMLASLVALAVVAAPGRAEDAAAEFTPNTNLAGAAWTYGWKPTRTGAFTLFATSGTDGVGQKFWNHPSQAGVYHNPSGGPVSPASGVSIPGRTLTLRAGNAGQYAVLRWTARFAATYEVRARFTARSASDDGKDAAVVSGGSVLYGAWMSPAYLGNTLSMSTVLALPQGATIDFVVGPGDDGNFADWVGLDATVVALPPPVGPAGPVLVLGGQRFVPCRWPGEAFESIAFDPVNRRLASRGDLSDLCGNRISDGPGEAPGLAWDLRTQTYWQVTNDRTVRRWSAAGALLDTLFTIPPTFTVPGSGLDTLESVRGIAVDSTFVYLVDAGPDPGQIPSNAWFKFTRAGAPVKSSRSTNLHAHLDMAPDALVDDIVYSPFSSPLLPGRLLIALEHSGIQVVDTEGNFVTKFLWNDAGLTRDGSNLQGKVPAFAGLGLDPATGNLYLVNNDTGDAQVWTRLATPGATSYVVGLVGNGPGGVLHHPNPGCNLPLWHSLTNTGASNFFGAAYRASDHAFYTCDFSFGELWKGDARTGAGARLGHTGINSVWGVAWDTERQVLYAASQAGAGNRIFVVDPLSGASSPLPQLSTPYVTDLAFNDVDRKLYGVDAGAGAQLIRFDRDTGAGTVVGSTVAARGIDYDPVTGKLVAISSNGRLYRITPGTGAAETLAVLPNATAWEGLAVVPVAANPTVSVEVAAPEGSDLLRAWPNPARGSATTVEFAMAQEGEARVRVFDVTGRTVRTLGARRFSSGVHRLEWDGRDDGGGSVAAGVYFVRVETGAHARVTRVTRMR